MIYQEAFSLWDKDGSGSIDKDELSAVFKACGQNPSDKELDILMKQVDLNGNGAVDFEEFLTLMRNGYERDPNKLQQAFLKEFDKGDGEFVKAVFFFFFC